MREFTKIIIRAYCRRRFKKNGNQVITFVKVRDISTSSIFYGSVVKNGSIFTNTNIPNQVFYYIKINLRNFFEDLLLKILVQSTSTENTRNTKISSELLSYKSATNFIELSGCK